MPDLIAALAIGPTLPSAVIVPPRAATVALLGEAPIAVNFGLALNGLLLPGLTVKGNGERQADAETGKELPLGEEVRDPTLIWLPDGFLPAQLPVTSPDVAADVAGTALDPTPATAVALPVAAASVDQAGPAPLATDPTSGPANVPLPVALAQAETPVVVEVGSDAVVQPAADQAVEIKAEIAPRGRFDGKPVHGATELTPPTRVALQPAPAAPPAFTTGAAAQVFAAALTTPAGERASLDRVNDAALLLHGHARAEQQTSVQALSAASQAPLDMTRDDWTGAMIDRIAALRDSAEAVDTRIKLAPENLGALEVSIRRDGDRIHVHFSAENPAARQMIADAAPRLNELADARGVKLGQTSVDGGSERGARRDTQQQSAQTPAPNLSVARPAGVDADERIA